MLPAKKMMRSGRKGEVETRIQTSIEIQVKFSNVETRENLKANIPVLNEGGLLSCS